VRPHLRKRTGRVRAAGRELGANGPERGREVSPGRAATSTIKLTPGVAAALAAAEIPPSKLGPSRRARLSDRKRELYFWILREFARDGRPSSEEVRAAAERLGLDGDDALASLAPHDL